MDVNYDIWTGESIQDLIQIIAEFRFQLFAQNDLLMHSLSEEINFLQHYFDSDSCIVVANDCGIIVGYMSLVDYSDHHDSLIDYEHYGSDLKISEGPMVHQNYRNMGIAKGLIQESINVCELKDLSLLIIDAIKSLETNDTLSARLAHLFNFESTILSNNQVYVKNLLNDSVSQAI